MRILLVRLSAIGDVVMASGLLPAIKSRYPGAWVTWLVEPAAAPLLKENPHVDEVLVWPKSEWKRLWQEKKLLLLWKNVRTLRHQLKEQRFDLALDTQGILKSSLLTWLSGAPQRVGLGRKEGSHWFHTVSLERDPDDPKMCSEYKTMAHYLGAPDGAFAMMLPYTEKTGREALELLDMSTEQSAYAVICPFTTRAQKHWVDDYWVELVTALQREFSFRVVMLGGPDDAEHARLLVEKSEDALINLVGRTSLLHAVAIIDKAALLVGVDTGLTHVGVAKKVPTVAIFGSTRPYLETDSSLATVLYEDMSCSPCRRRPTCGGEFTCMKKITAAKVMNTIKGMLL